MYRLITSCRGTDDLSIGFDRIRDRKLELTNNEKMESKPHVTIMLDDFLGFCDNQLKGTCGLGYRLTLTKNSENAVLNKGNSIKNAKIKIISIDWYVKNYTHSIEQQPILMKQIVDKTPKKLYYPERSVFLKEVNTQNL